jgi:hypothetical protein
MRSDLRLADLDRVRVQSKLMNVMVPDTLNDAIERIVADLQCSKAAAVIALLNEGLAEFEARHRSGLRPSGRRRRGRPPADLVGVDASITSPTASS